MNVEQLQKILREYPPERRLNLLVDGELVQSTTVLEIRHKLEWLSPHAYTTIFGRDSCIFRERVEDLDAPPGAAQTRKWLEIDLR